MVQLSEIHSQWPWNAAAPQDFSDKEILTHTVLPEDSRRQWVATVLPCMPGYAYVGFRVVAEDPNVEPEMVGLYYSFDPPRIIFGVVTDTQVIKGGCRNWTMFKYPVLERLCHLGEDEIHLHVFFEKPMCGKVEFLAQRFDDLLEDDSQIDYYFIIPDNENQAGRDGWVLTRDTYKYWLQDALRRVEYPNAKVIYRLR